jgi:P27 family predicted phage terminase small subunit
MGARGRKSAADLATSPIVPVRLVEPVPPLELPPPPDHLSPAMQGWWRQVVAEYDLDPHHLKLLEAAADAWDRMAAARSVVAAQGLTVTTKHGVKKHPAVDIERDSRIAFSRILRELDLDEPVPSPAAYVPPPAIRSNRRR